MFYRYVHRCQCSECRKLDSNPTKDHHTQLNLFLQTLTDEQRRRFVGLEANRLGTGSEEQVSVITGLSLSTIVQGQRELKEAQMANNLPNLEAEAAYRAKVKMAEEFERQERLRKPPKLPLGKFRKA